MAGLVQFTRFYTQHGIRNIGQLLTLRQNDITTFALPLNSALHFAVRDTGEIGLTEEDELLVNAGQRILTDYRFTYAHSDPIGAPLKLQRLPLKEIKKFLGKNKRFKFVNHSKAWIDVPAVPFIINYNSIDTTYRYRQRDGVDYWRRVNFYKTVIAGVNEELKRGLRNQFIYLDIPDVLPGINRLEEAEAQMIKNVDKELPLDRRIRNVFNTDGLFVVLSFWLWAGEHPELSIFGDIPEDKLDRVNFITSLDGRYSVLNLGTFKKWIRTPENQNGAMNHRRAQRALLRHFMALQQIRSVNDDTVIVDEESALDASTQERVLGIRIDEGKLVDLVDGDREFTSGKPDQPILDVNLDTAKLPKGKTVNVDAKSKVVDLGDPLKGGNDAEDFLFDQMDKDLQQLTATAAQVEADNLIDSEAVYKEYTAPIKEPTTKIIDLSNDLASKGLLSSAEIRRLHNLANRYKELKSPFDDNQSLEEYMEINQESLKIVPEEAPLTKKEIKGVLDKSMLDYSIRDFKSRYINEVMGKDLVNAVMHIQNAGIAVTDINLTRTDEYHGSYQTLSVQLTPVIGKPSTVKFKIPVIDEDGIFMANGVRYKMKTQRIDAPIRKVSEDEVALTSYMSKMFVRRTDRAAFNYGRWLVNTINLMSVDSKSGLKDVSQNNVFDPTKKLPLTYSTLARDYSSFTYADVVFHFDYNKLESNFSPDILSAIDRRKYIPIAARMTEVEQQVIVMGMDDQVSVIDLKNKSIRKVGRFSELLGINPQEEPVSYAEVSVLGYKIPIVYLLGYQIGFGNLLKTTKVKYRREKRGRGGAIGDTEFGVYFEDEILVFDRNDPIACLVFGGLNRLKSTIRKSSVYSLDKQDGYSVLMKALGIPLGHLKQYSNIFDIWVDHITRDLLIEMKEPTDLVLLFLSAVDKLKTDYYTDPNGVNESVLRGYQRMVGMVYGSLYKAARAYTANPVSKNAQIAINPNEVWFAITQDQTVAPIEESNPVHAIKENEVVVFRGAGGRGADTMMAKHRRFVRDSVGIISEANVDNGQVGTIAYLTADPNITSLRGTTEQVEDLKNIPKTKVQSTAMLLSPGSDTDD